MSNKENTGSKDTAIAAISLAVTQDRQEEKKLIKEGLDQ